MPGSDYLSSPDRHLLPEVAAAYDDAHDRNFRESAIGPAVDLLAELAGTGPVVEFAVGTGRLALPLSDRVSKIYGIDFSEPMLDVLRNKPGAERLSITAGDMTTTQVCSDASIVYLVYNTIENLRTQERQVQCFRNAAAHLMPGGRFVMEVRVPELHRLPAGETMIPFDVSPHHLGFEEYVDFVNQISISHHYYIDGDRVRVSSPSFRYAWPAELDLMAQLADMELENRWSDWRRSPFTNHSTGHVSVWRAP